MSVSSPSASEIAGAAVRRLPKAALIVLGLVVLPVVVGGLLGGPVGGPALVIGLVGGLAASMGRGYVTARVFLPVLAVAFVLGGLTVGTWWWVIIATAFAAFAGWSVALGLMPLFAMAAIVMVTAKPIDGLVQIVVAWLFVLLGGVLGTEIARRAGAPDRIAGKPETRQVGAMAAVALGLAVGIAATAGHLLDSERGYWIPMTVLILAQPSPEGRGRKSLERLIGTLVGIVVVTPLVALSVPRSVVALLALLSILLVIAVTAPYWLRVVFITTTVILAMAPPESAISFGERRLLETFLGVFILGLTSLFLLWWARRGHDPVALPSVPEPW